MAEDDELAHGRSGESVSDRVPIPDPTVLTTAALMREISGLRQNLELQIQTTRASADTGNLVLVDSINKIQEEIDRRLANLEKLRLAELKNISDTAAEARAAAEKASVEMQKQLDRRLSDLYSSLEDERRCERDITSGKVDALDKVTAGQFDGLHREIKDLSSSVLQRFSALEDRTAEQKSDNTKAIDKAEGATQKAIEKAEQNTSEQIRSIDSKISALSDALDRQIRDLKEQVDRGDRGGLGAGQDLAAARAERPADERREARRDRRALIIGASTVIGIVTTAVLGIIAAARFG